MSYDWDLSVLARSSTLEALANGFGVTLLLTFWSVLIGTPLGFVIGGVACVGDRRGPLYGELSTVTTPGKVRLRRTLAVIRLLALAYIDIIRAIPLLILILVSFYALPELIKSALAQAMLQVFGLDEIRNVSAFESGVVALVINLSAFVADLVRGAVAGVQRGGVLAARSLGMNNWLVWRRIVLPDIFREIFPALTLLWITIFKMSTLCSAITVYEVLHSADAVIQRTYKPLEVYLGVSILFIAMIVPLSALARRLERTQILRRRST